MSNDIKLQSPDEIRRMVSDRYGEIALRSTGCGCGSGCCSGEMAPPEAVSKKIGYSDEQLQAVPEGANLGLGCGNPTAIDALRAGEVVVDLGAGAGFDAFLAAEQVGSEGQVIGVDMTDEMLSRARDNAAREGITNVEFRKGHIESLPVDDEFVDVIISNCVVNLSPEKEKVFSEAYRVLKPGGRLMISDIVLDQPLPPAIEQSLNAYVGCIAGASQRQDYLEKISSAGFDSVEVVSESNVVEAYFDTEDSESTAKQLGVSAGDVRDISKAVTSVHVLATKPT